MGDLGVAPTVSEASAVGGRARPVVWWVTNVSAPYRRPVWAALGRRSQLSVGLLADHEPNRRWSAELPGGVDRLPLTVLAAHRGELHLYALRRRAMRCQKPDALILPGWESPAAWQLLAEARRRGVPCIGFYESPQAAHRFSKGLVAAARRRFFCQLDAVLTVGLSSRDTVRGFGVEPRRMVTTNNAVDVDGIRQAALRERMMPSVDRSSAFLFVGQLIRRKNIDGLLDAFAALPEGVQLTIAGEGPEESSLRAQAARLGIADRVRFLGYVEPEALPREFSAVSTLVLPSRVDVYGLVVNEALAAGLHVVVSEKAGVLADVRSMAGVYPAPPQPAALAMAMRRSREAWAGPILEPAILAHTPEAMAADVLRAVELARSGR